MDISCVSSLAYKNALYKIISCLGHNTNLHWFFSIDFNDYGFRVKGDLKELIRLKFSKAFTQVLSCMEERGH